MQEQLAALIEKGPWAAWKDRPGGVYLHAWRRPRGRGSHAVRSRRPSRAVGDKGELAHQLDRLAPAPTALDLPLAPRDRRERGITRDRAAATD